MKNKQKHCAVCKSNAKSLCASGKCFCAMHARCGKCNLVLSNGELRLALIILGSDGFDNARWVVQNYDSPIAADLVKKAIKMAIKKLGEGFELEHPRESSFLCGQSTEISHVPKTPIEYHIERR